MNNTAELTVSPEFQSTPATELETYLKDGGLYGLGEACVDGKVDPRHIDDIIVRLIDSKQLPSKFSLRILWYLVKHFFTNPQRGDGAFVVGELHYDLGNDLFSNMLDSTMSYTCGYWRNSKNLEEAQQAKLDLTCRKLKLSPGMKVLDIGCGFGNFAKFAAEKYGVTVVGLTISKEQAELARERCRGLPIEIILQDYRTFSGTFDRVVSIEMVEAVGRKNLKEYFAKIKECLVPEGLALIQAISAENFNRYSHPALDQYLVWIVKYIFPNGYLPTHNELVAPARSELVVEDIENFSADYERTLRAWRENFEQNWNKLEPKFGARFRRIWLYYLGGCLAFFQMRKIQLLQIVYAKNGVRGGYTRV